MKASPMAPTTALYLMLSFLSGIVELGAVTLVLKTGGGLAGTLAVGLAYQLGGLSVRVLADRPVAIACGAAASGLIVLTLFGHIPMGVVGGVLLVSVGLQAGRERAGQVIKVTTLLKRVCRIAGFILSGLLTYTGLLVASVVTLGALLSLSTSPHQGQTKEPGRHLQRRPDSLSIIMITHQTHYFVYAYLIPFTFIAVHGFPSGLVGVLFAVGWVSYAAAPAIFTKRPPLLVFAGGHMLAGLSLVTLAWQISNPEWFILAWFISGFGGGTVFVLRRLEQESPNPPDLDLWENVGHVTGVGLALLVVSTLGGGLRVGFALAAGLAAITSVALPVSIWFRRR